MISAETTNRIDEMRRAVSKRVIKKRRLTLLELLSPLAYLLFVIVTLFMTGIDNPVGWASTYTYFQSITPEIGATYIAAFVCWLIVIRILRGARKGWHVDPNSANELKLDISVKFAWRLFWIAAFFQAVKFVNIGSIPLFGSPLDRYKLTVGGFEDYPSRLLAPIATFFFCYGVVRGRLTTAHWITVAVAALLNIFMTQRQEVVNLLLGCGLVWSFNKRAKFNQLIGLTVALLVLAYVVIGLGAIVRYGGASAISTRVAPIALPMWIVHAELTVPYVFGEHVVAQLNGNFLYGLYTFGEFIAIFSPVKVLHGASLMQSMYTSANTAQSVGAPYSYYIDFGYAGLIVIGIGNSLMMSYFYRGASTNRTSSYWLTSYAMMFVSAFWSVRSGISLIYPLVLYILVGLFCVTKGGGQMTGQVRLCARIMFAVSLGLSFSALVLRH